MKAEQIKLNQDWIIIKPDVLKTFKHVEVQPILPKQEGMNVVRDEEEEVEEVEVEEVERTIAYVIQKGTVQAIGPGETMFAVGDKVFFRGGTGVDFQWLGVPSKGTSPKLLKKYEIIGKLQ
jgi:hypothetical protein